MKLTLLSNPYIKAFLLSISLLTRIPIPHLPNLQPGDSGRSALFYPVSGLIIGLILCTPLLGYSNHSTVLFAALITVIWAAITGALHLDGLADSADGWLGGLGDSAKTQEIMKDPLVGTAGVVAIVSILLLKFAALIVLLQQYVWVSILLAPVLGRGMILVLFLSTPYVQTEGMARNIIDYIPRKTAIFIVIICSFIFFTFSMWGVLFVVAGFFMLRRMMKNRLGGCTGDTAGATVEISETLWLLGTAFFL